MLVALFNFFFVYLVLFVKQLPRLRLNVIVLN